MLEGSPTPRGAQDRQALLQAGSAFAERHAEGGELLAQPTGSDPEHEPAGGDLLRGAGGTGGQKRMTQRQDVDAGRELHPRRERGGGAQRRPRVQQPRGRADDRPEMVLVRRLTVGRMLAGVVVRQDEVLAQPECVEAGLIGRDGEVQQVTRAHVVHRQADPHPQLLVPASTAARQRPRRCRRQAFRTRPAWAAPG